MPNTFDNILIGLVVLTWLMWRQGATIMLYLAVSLGAQRLTIRARAHDGVRSTSNAA